jgi:hypothetical protein
MLPSRARQSRCYGLPQGALASHHKTANIAKSAHQSALVAWCVTTANMMLMMMHTSATIFPMPKNIIPPLPINRAVIARPQMLPHACKLGEHDTV